MQSKLIAAAFLSVLSTGAAHTEEPWYVLEGETETCVLASDAPIGLRTPAQAHKTLREVGAFKNMETRPKNSDHPDVVIFEIVSAGPGWGAGFISYTRGRETCEKLASPKSLKGLD